MKLFNLSQRNKTPAFRPGMEMRPGFRSAASGRFRKPWASARGASFFEKSSGLILKVVENPDKSKDREQLLKKIKFITKEVRADFDYLIENIWFPKADICVCFENRNREMLAYTLGGWLYPQKTAIIYSTVVKEAYQHKNLSNTLNFVLLKKLFLRNFFRRFYCVARTANPVVVAAMGKYMNAYPSPYRSSPDAQEVEIASEIAKMLSPDKEFNPQTFVIKKAFLQDGNLPKEFSNIPHYSDKINSFCDRYLQYDKKEGDAFVIVGQASFRGFVKYFFGKYFSCFFTKRSRGKKHSQGKFWTKYFEVYDVLNKSAAYNELLNNVVSSADLQSKERILDLGCGTGNLYRALESKGVYYVGIDSCIRALDIARLKMADNNQASLIRCDIKNLCFKDSSFDKILSNNVLYLLNERAVLSVLNEAYRVLRKGGLLVATGLIRGFNPFAIYRDSVIKALKMQGIFRSIVDFVKTLPYAVKVIYYNQVYIKSRRKQYTFFDDYLIRKLFTKSNFKIIQTKKVYAGQCLLIIGKRE